MIRLWSIRCFLFIVMIAAGCKESYDPKIPAVKSNYLVVEGFINVNGFTRITLSRTLPLKDTSSFKPELGAQVTIAGEDNSTFNVSESGNGNYISDSLILNVSQKYRLHIKTAAGGEYLSEYAAVKLTPPIDSVNWKLENGGVQIYVSTHDPQNNTRYYKWDYEETWEIHSKFESHYVYNSDLNIVVPRDLNETPLLYYCWQSKTSNNIFIGSSSQLASDIISPLPIELVPNGSIKTGIRFSILVQQHSLDTLSYNFFQQMKRNTESLGSVFDALPSEITGNITCVSNPLEKVIGFISASSLQQKRIFITSYDIGGSTYSQDCDTIFILNKSEELLKSFKDFRMIPFEVKTAFGLVVGYYSGYDFCVDCRVRGTNIKPSFW